MNLTYDNHNELTYLTYDIFLPSIQKKFIVFKLTEHIQWNALKRVNLCNYPGKLIDPIYKNKIFM